jgi:hypothetical protein
MGTLNYQTSYMRKKIQNLPLNFSKMNDIDILLMFMEFAAIGGAFKDLDPRDFGADYDRVTEDK